jgi:hypothetical protein
VLPAPVKLTSAAVEEAFGAVLSRSQPAQPTANTGTIKHVIHFIHVSFLVKATGIKPDR